MKTMITLHVASCIPQVDGALRFHLMVDAKAARSARAEIRNDPAMIECCRGDYVIDREESGRLVAQDWPGPASRKPTKEEWAAIKAAIAGA